MPPDNYQPLEQCVACGGGRLHTYLDLHNQPLANSYHNNTAALPQYPLALNVCRDCWHSQLTVAVAPALMFREYLYVTGTSQTLRDYCDWFAAKMTALYPQAKTVLDIACNDGTQLDSFARLGWQTMGVDPAENLHAESSKRHTVVCDFWPLDLARRFDLIIAQNVFAHNSDPHGFLLGIKSHLSDDGVAVIQTSQAYWLENNQFDTTYHEHISFFCTNSMEQLCKRAGMHLNRVEIGDVHGGSYLFFISTKPANAGFCNADEWVQKESHKYSLAYHQQFAGNAKKCLDDLKNAVDTLQSKGVAVFGYGAAAKGNTVLNAGRIQLNGIIDDNPLKVGSYTPGSNIKIHHRAVLNETAGACAIVPLAWNFFDEISNKCRESCDKKLTYIKYFPQLEITQ